MNTVIIGQGAIGLLVYHRLSRVNYKNKSHHIVSLLPSTIKASSHYTFHEINALGESFPLVIADEDDLINAQVIIVCVKSYQVAKALQSIIHLISKNAVIIFTHNGLGTFEEIQYLLQPSQCLLALLLTQGAKKNNPYHVKHTGMGDSDLGIICGEIEEKIKDELLAYFQQGLKQVNWQDDIQQAQWKKLAINCVINPITAIEDIDNGDINYPIYQNKIVKVIDEIVIVSVKEGIHLSAEKLLSLVNKIATNTAKNTSSMRADVIAERKTEIDYINGYIHRLGEKHQVATPMNTQQWLAVKALEKRL